jgi:hypothetical protein
MCSPNNISSSHPPTAPIVPCYFNHFPSTSRCSDLLLTSIITLGAVVRTTFNSENSENLKLRFKDGVVDLTYSEINTTYKPDITQALNTLADESDSLTPELLEESHNLLRMGLTPPNPVTLTVESQDFINALSTILNSESTQLRLLGVKLWLTFSNSEPGEKARELIIHHFPSILPSADLFIRTQLSTAMPFLPEEVRRNPVKK